MHERSGRRLLKSYRVLGDMQVVQLAAGETVEEVLRHYQSSGLVEFAEPDYKLRASLTPNDPEFTGGTQWSLRNSAGNGRDINAVEAWETLHSASNVVVAVIDSGIRITHEDLAGNLWVNPREIPDNGIDDDGNGIVDDVHGINAINSTGKVSDEAGHGTHVAGIIGAVGNNGVGISGVAWKVQLMACKFLDRTGDGDTSDAIRCVDYARRNGAQIINASWGGGDYSTALYNAIASARAAGIIVVTAAGNESRDIDTVPLYPACYNLDNIVSVGGTSRQDTLDAGYSNYGALNVDLCAPGSGIYSTWNSWDGSYSYLSGTSMAAPHVTGALALMKARFPAMTPAQLIARLYATVDLLPALAGKCKTGGRLNLGRALGTDPAANFSASRLTGEPPLSVTFTNLTAGELKSVRWNFGDGTPEVTSPQPTHVFAKAGSFTVRLTVAGTNNRTNSIEQMVQVIPNYEIQPVEYAWVDPAGMTELRLADNGVSPAQGLPFPFQFYGQTYSSIYVGANGVLGFSSAGLSTTDNTSLPSAGNPNAIICPYWDNLNPAGGGAVYAGISGTAPARRFVVSWVEVPRNSSAIDLTFQAILEEESSEIVLQYRQVHADTVRGGAKRATVGVENSSGTVAVLYTFNGSPHVLQDETALRIKPRSYRYLVSETGEVRLTAVAGLPPPETSGEITISNPGNLDLDWTVESAQAWMDLPERGGTLRAGESHSVPVRLSARASSLAPGAYRGAVTLKNATDGGGGAVIPVEAAIEEPRAALAAFRSTPGQFAGGLGGPFSPASVMVELRNTGNIALDWSALADAAWLEIHPSGGSLLPGETERVDLMLSPAAEDLASGTFETLVRFENLANPAASASQLVRVEVRARVVQTAAVIANGIFNGRLEVPEGSGYVVEYSDDFQTWSELLSTPDLDRGVLRFEDPETGWPRRFYRVRVEGSDPIGPVLRPASRAAIR